MAQLLKKIGIFALLALLPAQALAAPVTLNGSYLGEMGQLDLQTGPDGRVIGRYSGGGACTFDPQRPVLDGEMEGKVLVASVTLCQRGPGCEERPYTVLAFYETVSGALVADVKLDAGCDSPALKESRLVLRPAKAGEARPMPITRKLKRDECRESLQKGKHLFGQRDYAGASFYFARGLSCDPKNWAAHLSLGISELRRGNTEAAVDSLEHARDLSIAANQEEMSIYYNLACANARRGDRKSAFKNLRRALELGFADPEVLATDPDLQVLRDDPEFRAVKDSAWAQKDHATREATTRKGEQ